MPKVLLVGISPRAADWYHARKTLYNFGIDTAVAYSSSKNADVQTPAGAFASGSPDLRNYLKQYDAVFVLERQSWSDNWGCRGPVRWLDWNTPDDPPVVYFGWHFGAANTEITGELPADFPLLRIVPANLPDTAALADGGQRLCLLTITASAHLSTSHANARRSMSLRFALSVPIRGMCKSRIGDSTRRSTADSKANPTRIPSPWTAERARYWRRLPTSRPTARATPPTPPSPIGTITASSYRSVPAILISRPPRTKNAPRTIFSGSCMRLSCAMCPLHGASRSSSKLTTRSSWSLNPRT